MAAVEELPLPSLDEPPLEELPPLEPPLEELPPLEPPHDEDFANALVGAAIGARTTPSARILTLQCFHIDTRLLSRTSLVNFDDIFD